MTRTTFLHILWWFGVFQPDGLTLSVHTERTVMAILGEEAQLRCQLLMPPDVVDVFQVSWYKVLPDGDKMVAADNKDFGQRVEPEFSSRVGFEDASLQDSSIVIKEVTEEDEGCYRCSFYTYFHGALIATTCMQVLELHEPVLRLRESKSTKEFIVSCTATGQPTPTVTITAPQQDLYLLHNDSVSVFNNDSTVTVTRTAVLSRLHENSTQVGCTAEVLSSPKKAVFMMLSEVRPMSDEDGSEEEAGGEINRRGRSFFIWPSVLLIGVFVVAVFFFLLRYKNPTSRSRDVLEMNENPEAILENPHKEEESLQENPPVRLRPSPVKREENRM